MQHVEPTKGNSPILVRDLLPLSIQINAVTEQQVIALIAGINESIPTDFVEEAFKTLRAGEQPYLPGIINNFQPTGDFAFHSSKCTGGKNDEVQFGFKLRSTNEDNLTAIDFTLRKPANSSSIELRVQYHLDAALSQICKPDMEQGFESLLSILGKRYPLYSASVDSKTLKLALDKDISISFYKPQKTTAATPHWRKDPCLALRPDILCFVMDSEGTNDKASPDQQAARDSIRTEQMAECIMGATDDEYMLITADEVQKCWRTIAMDLKDRQLVFLQIAEIIFPVTPVMSCADTETMYQRIVQIKESLSSVVENYDHVTPLQASVSRVEAGELVEILRLCGITVSEKHTHALYQALLSRDYDKATNLISRSLHAANGVAITSENMTVCDYEDPDYSTLFTLEPEQGSDTPIIYISGELEKVTSNKKEYGDESEELLDESDDDNNPLIDDDFEPNLENAGFVGTVEEPAAKSLSIAIHWPEECGMPTTEQTKKRWELTRDIGIVTGADASLQQLAHFWGPSNTVIDRLVVTRRKIPPALALPKV